jgi:GTPase SAR1 family protein
LSRKVTDTSVKGIPKNRLIWALLLLKEVMSNSLEAKIVVLGSQGVGKTSLVHRYVKNNFAPPDIVSTIGASFMAKKIIDIDSSTVVRLQIWDTAGQERFRSISKLYYRGMCTFNHCQTLLCDI